MPVDEVVKADLSALKSRLEVIENANLIERFNYWESRRDAAVASEYEIKQIDADIKKRLEGFNVRLSKIEQFTNYLLDFFNPDHKLKKKIAELEKQMEAKDKRIAEFEKKLKDLLNAN